jgi:hypothetical protein
MNLGILLAVSALILARPAFGHEVTNGPHGGRVAEAGDYHVELVANQNLVEVYLTDGSDKPIAPAGFKGIAILVIGGGKSTRVTLEPTGDTKLSGKAAGVIPSDPPGVVQITTPDGKTAQARYH